MPMYEKDEKSKQIVPVTGEVPQEVIAAIEKADDDAIIAKLTNVNSQPAYAYAYPIKTKEGTKYIIGIGVDGAKAIAYELGNIKVSTEIKVEERGDDLYGVVPVTNLARNITLLGAAKQSKYILDDGLRPTDRLDGTAWVKLINKCQRNGILAVAPQDVIYNIINKLDPKLIKQISALPDQDDDKVKKMRQQLAIEAGKVFKTDEERKEWQKEKFGVDSIKQMNETQLREAINEVKQKQMPDPTTLGFTNIDEQIQMRKELFNLIGQLGYKTNEEKTNYVSSKNWIKTYEATKDQLQKYIQEVKSELEIANQANELFKS